MAPLWDIRSEATKTFLVDKGGVAQTSPAESLKSEWLPSLAAKAWRGPG